MSFVKSLKVCKNMIEYTVTWTFMCTVSVVLETEHTLFILQQYVLFQSLFYCKWFNDNFISFSLMH